MHYQYIIKYPGSITTCNFKLLQCFYFTTYTVLVNTIMHRNLIDHTPSPWHMKSPRIIKYALSANEKNTRKHKNASLHRHSTKSNFSLIHNCLSGKAKDSTRADAIFHSCRLTSKICNFRRCNKSRIMYTHVQLFFAKAKSRYVRWTIIYTGRSLRVFPRPRKRNMVLNIWDL